MVWTTEDIPVLLNNKTSFSYLYLLFKIDTKYKNFVVFIRVNTTLEFMQSPEKEKNRHRKHHNMLSARKKNVHWILFIYTVALLCWVFHFIGKLIAFVKVSALIYQNFRSKDWNYKEGGHVCVLVIGNIWIALSRSLILRIVSIISCGLCNLWTLLRFKSLLQSVWYKIY